MISSYKCVLSLLGNYLKENTELLISDNLDEVIDLANKLSISPIVSYVLNKNGYKGYENPAFNSYREGELQKVQKEELSKLLDINNIEYMYIKGTTIRKYYKDPYLRFGCDIDVVVREKDFKKVIDIFNKEGYKQVVDFKNERCFETTTGILIDIHKVFIENGEYINNYLLSKFNNKHELDVDDEYLLLIAHSAKHFNHGTMDLRVFSDMFFIKDLCKNRKNIEELLKKDYLLNYEKLLINYLNMIIGKYNGDEMTLILDDFIEFKTHNIGDNNFIISKVIKGNLDADNKRNGVLTYIKNRIFIPKSTLYDMFPNLKKHKYLLPFYYVYRVFLRLGQNGFKYIKEEVNNSQSLDNDRLNKYKKLYKEIGIYH